MPVRHWPNKPSDNSLFAQPAMPEHYLVAHIDGGARGNPGPAGYGVTVEDSEGQPIAELSEFLGIQTNNCAEYNGLLAALDFALKNNERNLRVLSDSELLVKQLKGQYKVSSPALKELYDRARKLIAQLEWFSVEHVRRERNREADALANEAMDRKRPGLVVRKPGEPKPSSSASNPISSAGTSSPPRDTSPHAGSSARSTPRECRGVVRNGVVELIDKLPDGTRVLVKPID
jgi:ribonuclease HI